MKGYGPIVAILIEHTLYLEQKQEKNSQHIFPLFPKVIVVLHINLTDAINILVATFLSIYFDVSEAEKTNLTLTANTRSFFGILSAKHKRACKNKMI